MGDDTQQRAAGRTSTRAAAKDSAYMGHTLLLGKLEVAPNISNLDNDDTLHKSIKQFELLRFIFHFYKICHS